VALAAEVGRIANRLCICWPDPESCQSYFDDLRGFQAGGRRGFPVTVMRELAARRAYYATKHMRY